MPPFLVSRLSWASGLKYPIGDFTVLTLQSRLSWASGLNMRYVTLRCCDSVLPFVGAWSVFFVFHEGINHIVFIKLIYAFMVLCQIDKNQSEVVATGLVFSCDCRSDFSKEQAHHLS